MGDPLDHDHLPHARPGAAGRTPFPAPWRSSSRPALSRARALVLAAPLGLALLAGAPLVSGTAPVSSAALAAEEIETPDHEVLRAEGPIELRRYEPMIVAQITIEAPSRDAASSAGFMPLAGYIFGNNGPSERIAMTAPVTTSPAEGADGSGGSASGGIPGGDGTKIAMTAPVTTQPASEAASGDEAADGAMRPYTVRFMMPSRWTMETLPKPADERVELVEVPSRTLLTYRFTGPRERSRIEEGEAALASFIEKEGLTRTGPSRTAGYDGPSTPPAKRRWEVQIPVEDVAGD